MPPVFKYLVLLLAWPLFAHAQVQIFHPMPRLVVQRGASGNGQIYLSGRLTTPADRVEALLTPVVPGQGNATGWQTVQVNPANSLFLGSITGTGGWYVLTVRTIVNNIETSQATVQPVGIGEVFITAGQSNSRGLGVGDNDLGTATDRVSAIDSINHSYPPGAQALVSSGDPSPVAVYKSLTAGRRIFPMAESSWGWGELGDYVVNRYNVPVAFYVAGWDGSTIENWINSANGIPTCNRYWCVENWPNLQPYTNLKNIFTYYTAIAGARAVLWHQGEAEFGDAGSGSVPEYRNRLTALIQKSRQDLGGRNLPWVVARASFDGSTDRPSVISAQQQIIDTPGLNVFQGPYNDTLVNRNAGTSDVHFRNARRPAIHPRYYLAPNTIPVDMGLSRFARNWNNSLNAAFFQNAQPITPNQFAATGMLADYVLPADSLRVSFATLGSFAANTVWQVQLLDSLGHFKAILGSGTASPVRVKLPNSYQRGRFQVRVVSPGLAAVPSNLFRITAQPPTADLSMDMGIDRRTPDLNGSVTLTMVVRNDGPNDVTNVAVRNRLPSNLTVISAPNLVLTGNVLTGTIASLPAGTLALLNFTAQPTAAGTYRNGAEIVASSLSDPDSQLNSGIGDGQDDMAWLDFRTRQPGPAVFTSPNPDQVPLPALIGNQPLPDPAKADLSLSLWVSNRAPRLNDTITYVLTLSNAGGLSATGLSVAANLPAGQVFVPGDDMAPANGSLVGGVSMLPANGRIIFRLRARIMEPGRGVCTAQLMAANQPDPDSVAGNGVLNGEDDTAQTDVRAR